VRDRPGGVETLICLAWAGKTKPRRTRAGAIDGARRICQVQVQGLGAGGGGRRSTKQVCRVPLQLQVQVQVQLSTWPHPWVAGTTYPSSAYTSR
jgi:hypothetical protein